MSELKEILEAFEQSERQLDADKSGNWLIGLDHYPQSDRALRTNGERHQINLFNTLGESAVNFNSAFKVQCCSVLALREFDLLN